MNASQPVHNNTIVSVIKWKKLEASATKPIPPFLHLHVCEMKLIFEFINGKYIKIELHSSFTIVPCSDSQSQVPDGDAKNFASEDYMVSHILQTLNIWG